MQASTTPPSFEPFTTTILRGWKRIVAYLLVFGVLGGLYTIFWPAQYECDAVLVLPTPNDQNSLVAAITNQQNPLTILEGILSSQATADFVAKKLQMDPDDVADMLNVKDSEDENQILISVRNHNKALAKIMVASSIEALKELEKTVGFSVAQKQEKYLDQAVRDRNKDLNDSENLLLEMEKHAKTPVDPTNPFSSSQYVQRYKDLEFQLKAATKAIDIYVGQAKNVANASLSQVETGLPGAEMWRQKVEDLQYQMHVAEISFGASAPQVKALEEQIKITEDGLSAEVAKYLKSIQGNVDTNLVQLISAKMLLEWEVDYVKQFSDAAPDEAVAFERQMQEVTARADVYKLVREEYEMAKLDTQVDKVQWGVLVEPYVLKKATNKHHGLNLAVALLIGLIVGIIAVVGRANKVGRELAAEGLS